MSGTRPNRNISTLQVGNLRYDRGSVPANGGIVLVDNQGNLTVSTHLDINGGSVQAATGTFQTLTASTLNINTLNYTGGVEFDTLTVHNILDADTASISAKNITVVDTLDVSGSVTVRNLLSATKGASITGNIQHNGNLYTNFVSTDNVLSQGSISVSSAGYTAGTKVQVDISQNRTALTGIAVRSADVNTILGTYGSRNVGSLQATKGGATTGTTTPGTTAHTLAIQPRGGATEIGAGSQAIADPSGNNILKIYDSNGDLMLSQQEGHDNLNRLLMYSKPILHSGNRKVATRLDIMPQRKNTSYDVSGWVTLDPNIFIDGASVNLAHHQGGISTFGSMFVQNDFEVGGRISGNGSVPTGSVNMYIANVAPAGWLLCDGSAVNRNTYSALYSIIGDTFGAGDGLTSFNLPNFCGRSPLGVNPNPPLNGLSVRALGTTGGTENETLTSAQIPAHQHDYSGNTNSIGDHKHALDILLPTANSGSSLDLSPRWGYGESNLPKTYSGLTELSGGHLHTYSGTTNNNTGGGNPHNNMHPFLAINFIIKT